MNPQRRGDVVALVAIVLLGIVLRCAAINLGAAAANRPGENTSIALNLLNGNGFSFAEFGRLGPTSIRGPVYPFLLAGLFWEFGTMPNTGPLAAVALNVLAAAGSCVVAYVVVRKIHSRRAGLIAALCFAVWPTQIYAAGLQQGLVLTVLLALGTLYFIARDEVGFAIPAGLCGGLAVLTEPVLSLPLFLLSIFIGRRRAVDAMLMLLTAMMLIAPWLARNAVVHGQFSGITDNFWPDVFRGNGPDATGSAFLRIPRYDAKPLSQMDRLTTAQTVELKTLSETGRVRWFETSAKAWIAANPLTYAKLCAWRAAKTLWLDWHHPLARQWPTILGRSIALIGFIAFAFMRLPNIRHRVIVLLLAIGLVLACMFSLAEARTAVLMEIPQLIGLSVVLSNAAYLISKSPQREKSA